MGRFGIFMVISFIRALLVGLGLCGGFIAGRVGYVLFRMFKLR